MLSTAFNFEILEVALNRHAKRPLKALLLDQRYFPEWGTGWQMKCFGERTCIRIVAHR